MYNVSLQKASVIKMYETSLQIEPIHPEIGILLKRYKLFQPE